MKFVILLCSISLFTISCSQKQTEYENFEVLASQSSIKTDDESIDSQKILEEVLEDLKREAEKASPLSKEEKAEKDAREKSKINNSAEDVTSADDMPDNLDEVLDETVKVEAPDIKSDSSWKPLLNSRSNRISIGASYIGPHPLESNETGRFVPASITKVITSMMALESLGADFRFETALQWKQIGSEAWDVTIVGAGDPTLGVKEFTKNGADVFDTLTKGLIKSGVKTIHGSIKTQANDSSWYSTAPAEGIRESNYVLENGHFSNYLNYALNWGTLNVRSGGAINWTEAGLDFPVINNLQRARTKKLYTFSTIRDSKEEITQVKLSGLHSKTSSSKTLQVPVFNSASWVKNILTMQIKKSGITILLSDKLPSPLIKPNKITKYYSAPLAEIMKLQNKRSINIFADSIYKASAIKMKSVVSALDPITKINELANSNMRLFINRWAEKLEDTSITKSIHIVDGAGLSHSNFVTADAYMQLLLYASKQSYFYYLWDSLPIACVDGTLGSRMCGTAAAKLVRAKTGTINGYYQLAGYIPKMQDSKIKKTVPFVLLTNAPESLRASARKFQDRVVAKMTEKVNH